MSTSIYSDLHIALNLAKLEDALSISFSHKELLVQALLHKSYRHPNAGTIGNNERLEFFGDAVLKLMVSEYLFVRLPDDNEGRLTKIRSQIISDKSLGKIGRNIGLGNYILMSHSEENSNGRDKPSTLANALEALLGALYLDQGYDTTRAFFIGLFETYQYDILADTGSVDYKSRLQEFLQQHKIAIPHYRVVNESGPDHSKVFTVETTFQLDGSSISGLGSGSSKKDAEQECAQHALSEVQKFYLRSHESKKLI